MTLLALMGSAGMDPEWIWAAGGGYGPECFQWLIQWWDWESRWRLALRAEVCQKDESVWSRCLSGALPLWKQNGCWIRIQTATPKGPYRLGTIRLSEKNTHQPHTLLLWGVFRDPWPTTSPVPLWGVGYFKPCAVLQGAPLDQTYFLSTCRLE